MKRLLIVATVFKSVILIGQVQGEDDELDLLQLDKQLEKFSENIIESPDLYQIGKIKADKLWLKSGQYDNIRIDSVYKYVWIDNQWKRSIWTWYFYDEKGVNNLIMEPGLKTEFFDQDGGNYIVITSEQDYETGTWQEVQKRIRTYEKNMVITSNYIWEASSQKWIGLLKSEDSIDLYGNYVQEIDYKWDEDIDNWISNSSKKNEYQYDTKENIIEKITAEWDFSKNQWQYMHKHLRSFNDDGNLLTLYRYDWNSDSNDFVLLDKKEYTYNDKGDLLYIESFRPDDSENDWIIDSKDEYLYDENGNNTTFLLYHLNEMGELYVIDSIRYEYDINGNRTFRNDYKRYIGETEYSHVERDDCAFDSNGNRILHITYKSGEPSIPEYKRKFSYDTMYNYVNLMLPRYNPIDEQFWGETFVNNPVEYTKQNWDKLENEWVNTYKMVCFYSEHIIKIKSLFNGTPSIYPNPFSNHVSIGLPNNYDQIIFELFTVQGRKIIKKELSNNQLIYFDGLSSGMYLYNLYLDGEKKSGKLIKK